MSHYEIGCLMHRSVKLKGEMRHFWKEGDILINSWAFLLPIGIKMLAFSSISDLSNMLISSKNIGCQTLLSCISFSFKWFCIMTESHIWHI